MHIITYNDNGEYTFKFTTLSEAVRFSRQLSEKNIAFTHIFEE